MFLNSENIKSREASETYRYVQYPYSCIANSLHSVCQQIFQYCAVLGAVCYSCTVQCQKSIVLFATNQMILWCAQKTPQCAMPQRNRKDLPMTCLSIAATWISLIEFLKDGCTSSKLDQPCWGEEVLGGYLEKPASMKSDAELHGMFVALFHPWPVIFSVYCIVSNAYMVHKLPV